MLTSLSSSTSCHAISTDIPEPLSSPLPIAHCSRQVLRSTSRIATELLYIGGVATSMASSRAKGHLQCLFYYKANEARSTQREQNLRTTFCSTNWLTNIPRDAPRSLGVGKLNRGSTKNGITTVTQYHLCFLGPNFVSYTSVAIPHLLKAISTYTEEGHGLLLIG